MDKRSSYETYIHCLKEIKEQTRKENVSQEDIEEQERRTVSQIDSQFMTRLEELDSALKAVREQYQSVRESCTYIAGIRCPQDQRAESTTIAWEEAIHLQEIAASKIQNWMTYKSQQAIIEKQKQLEKEAALKREMEIAAAEAAKKLAEEAALEEKRRAESLVEEMKKKYRKRR